jgi:hypothetical protein
MNTERRHELEANSLARSLNEWSDRLRPYSNGILIAIAAVLLVYVGASMWSSYQASRSRAAWDDYELAVMENDGDQRGLQRLSTSEDHQGTEMQEWALMGWADRQLLRASQMYLTNREEAMSRLTNIAGIYDQYATTAEDPALRNRARLGLARANEMLGKVDEARQQYARVEGALAAVAADRIKELESKQAQETVHWLATTQLPKPSTPGGPGTPGKRPGFEGQLPQADAGKDASPGSLNEILRGLGDKTTSATPPTGEATKADASTSSDEPDVFQTPGVPAESTPAGVETKAAPETVGKEGTAPEAKSSPAEGQPAATESKPAESSSTPAAPTSEPSAPAAK